MRRIEPVLRSNSDPETPIRRQRRRRRAKRPRCLTYPESSKMSETGSVHGGGPREVLDDDDLPMSAHEIPILRNLRAGIIPPDITAQHFELKPVMFQMLQTIGQFHGLPSEDPYSHLTNVMGVADGFIIPGVPPDALRLTLFPYSLSHHAKQWLEALPPGSIRTWDQMAEAFIMRYFSPMKSAQLRSEIHSFKQLPGENISEAWERYKLMLKACPNHNISTWIQLQNFYNGLDETVRPILDASAGGAFLDKSYREALAIVEKMAKTHYQWNKGQRKAAGVMEVKTNDAQAAKISTLEHQIKLMNEKMNQLAPAPTQQANCVNLPITCTFCNGLHIYDECPQNPDSVNYVGHHQRDNYQVQGGQQQQGWKQQPYRQQGQHAQGHNHNYGQQRPPHPPGFQHQHHQQGSSQGTLQDMLKAFMSRTETMIQGHEAAIRGLEIQMGQMAAENKARAVGTLPSDTETPRTQGNEHIKAITLRSGKQLEAHSTTSPVDKPREPEPVSALEQEASPQETPAVTTSTQQEPEAKQLSQEELLKKYPPPFPQRLKKKQNESKYQKFLDMLKHLHINVPLVEALEDIPNYGKFMKDLLSRKRKLKDKEMVVLNQETSMYLQHKIPPKRKDPGSFTIPCAIGKGYTGRALCDLGASINLMPMSIFKKLGVGQVQPTNVTLQLVDRSITYPEGILEYLNCSMKARWNGKAGNHRMDPGTRSN